MLLTMDSLELPSLNAHKISHFNLPKEQSTRLLSKVHHFNSSMQPPSLKLSPTYRAQRSVCQVSIFLDFWFMDSFCSASFLVIFIWVCTLIVPFFFL
jgi:hypothetical protein